MVSSAILPTHPYYLMLYHGNIQPTDEKEHVKPHGERKFIVFEKNLLSLFASGPICAGPAEARITKIIGTMVKINQWCADEKSCQFCQMWFSQPFVKGQMPCGNLLLSAAILISG